MMKRWHVLGAAALIVAVALAAWFFVASGRPVAPDGPYVELWGDNAYAIVKIEVADNPIERGIGLMYRKSMDERAGMLFVFDDTGVYPFWMKNTYIPLDMLFISDNGTIVDIIPDTVPMSEERCVPDAEHKYVLEVNGGFCEKYGIETGDVIKMNLY